MAIRNLPFQPIQFAEEVILNCSEIEREICLMQYPTDDINFQWQSLPCGDDLVCDPFFSDELIVNGDFEATFAPWTLGAGWGWTAIGEQANFDGSLGTGDLMQTFTLGDIVPGAQYLLAFDCRITGTGDTILPKMNGVVGGFVSGPVNARQYQFFTAPVGADRITFTPSASAFGNIDNVSLVPMSGCWFATKEFIFENNKACHVVGLTGELDLLVTSVINTGYYQLIVTVTGVTTGTMTIHQGATPIGTITAPGIHTFYFNGPTGTFNIDFDTDAEWDGCVTEGHLYELADTQDVHLVDMDDVSVLDITAQVQKHHDRFWITGNPLSGLGIYNICLKVRVIDSCGGTHYTNCMKVFLSSQPCTYLVRGYKIEEGYSFGFYFTGDENTTFRIEQRLKLCAINPVYPTAGSDYTFSSNYRLTTSSEIQQFWEMIFSDVNWQGHSALASSSQIELFTVGGIEYFTEPKDYKPLWDGRNYTGNTEGRLLVLRQGDIARR